MSLRLLCVCAHPDDECFGFGGALALAAERAVETSVVCLTDGQAATHRGISASSRELGQMRREEFAASCHVLGVARSEVLDYHDGQLEFEDFNKLCQRLVERVRAFRPHVVMTFGNEGGLNTHPDHTMVSMATTAAFHWSGHPKRMLESGPLWKAQRLYYLSGSFVLPERPLPALAPWTASIDISSVFEKKKEAFRQHVSQAPLMDFALPLFEKYPKVEHYSLAATTVPQPARQSTDLFEGVAE